MVNVLIYIQSNEPLFLICDFQSVKYIYEIETEQKEQFPVLFHRVQDRLKSTCENLCT